MTWQCRRVVCTTFDLFRCVVREWHCQYIQQYNTKCAFSLNIAYLCTLIKYCCVVSTYYIICECIVRSWLCIFCVYDTLIHERRHQMQMPIFCSPLAIADKIIFTVDAARFLFFALTKNLVRGQYTPSESDHLPFRFCRLLTFALSFAHCLGLAAGCGVSNGWV